MAEEREIRCTFETCGLRFKSMSDMEHHNADAHPYCMKCKLGFQSYQALHLHKVMSDRHFACPGCSLEMRSEAGLEVHIRQNHQECREFTCVGCNSKHKSASAVIRHIEDKQCPILSLSDRNHGTGDLEFPRMSTVLTMGSASSEPQPLSTPSPDPSEDSDTDGGVLLYPNLNAAKGKRASREPVNASSPPVDWLMLDAKNVAMDEESGKLPTEPARGGPFEAHIVPSLSKSLAESLHTKTIEPLSSAAPVGPSHHRANIHELIQGMDPEEFWNADKGRYSCSCGASFLYVGTFKYHLTVEDERINDCPRCFKRFGTLAALVAHMEARYSKCAVRASYAQMEQELSEITQGLAALPTSDLESTDPDFDASSQPEDLVAWPSIIEAVPSIAETLSVEAVAGPFAAEAGFTSGNADFSYDGSEDKRMKAMEYYRAKKEELKSITRAKIAKAEEEQGIAKTLSLEAVAASSSAEAGSTSGEAEFSYEANEEELMRAKDRQRDEAAKEDLKSAVRIKILRDEEAQREMMKKEEDGNVKDAD